MKKILLALIIAALCIGVVSAQTDIFHKTGKRGSDINVTSVDARVVYTHPNGMRIDQRVYVDGVPMAVTFNSQSAKKETWGTGNGQGNSDVLVEHDFDNAVNDTLKCTITLKSPHEIYYPYTVQNGVSLVDVGQGNLKFVRDASGTFNDRYKPGVLVQAPVAWNKTGGPVPVWYTFTTTQINLNINDAGQEYPITIDPTLIPDIPLGYTYVTSFYYNLTLGAQNQTNYQMKFTLSNSSGISGFYSGENVIFTNGTTQPDWYDVNATDESSNPLNFWIENNTQTAKNATAWVKVPSLSVLNTSIGKWYYGNASQNGSTMNGYNTFPIFEDCIDSTINSTQWTNVSPIVLSGGICNVTSTGTEASMTTKTNAGINTSLVSRFRTGHNNTVSFTEVFAYRNGSATDDLISANPASSAPAATANYRTRTAATDTYTAMSGWSANTYAVMTMERNRTANVRFFVNNANLVTSSTNIPSVSLPVNIFTTGSGSVVNMDWVFIRSLTSPAPTTSLYSTSPTSNGTTLNASFTDVPDPSSTGQSVTFTDTSAGSPTTWNWTITGVGVTNTTQNMAYAFSTAGTYYIDLNVTNATGAFSNFTSTHTVANASAFVPQDVWMEGQYVQTFQITDSTTGLPISVVDLTLSPGGSTFTTTNGTGYLTTGFGIYTVTFVSTGYNGKTISYAFDSDQTHAVQLTPANPGGSQNVWYTPWQVRIRIVDYYGKPLPDTNVTAFYIASTLPNTNTTWLTSAYGISPEVATDMVNSAKAMDGRTDDNGGLSFTMFKSLEYHLEIVNSTSGVSATKNLYPSDPEYVIYVRTAGQTAANNTLGLRNGTLPWYSLNSTHISLNMSYIDGTLCTGNVTFRVWFRNNGSELHNTTQSAATGTQITDSHIVLKAPIGTEYLWGYNATTNC